MAPARRSSPSGAWSSGTRPSCVDALPEVDLFLGASEMDRLVPELDRARACSAATPMRCIPACASTPATLPHVRYLKISEGCDHGCAFCAIPLMRGKHRSFALDEVMREAQLLELQGAREVNLVAQDLAHYGRDRRDGVGLPELLEALVRETSIPWIRMLYLYSAGITPRLLEVIAREPRIVPLPRHADAARVRRSARAHAAPRAAARRSARRSRAFARRFPTSRFARPCIVGFPGETEEDFEELLDFLEEIAVRSRRRVHVFAAGRDARARPSPTTCRTR